MSLGLWLSSTNLLQTPRLIWWQDQAKCCRGIFNISLFEKSKQRTHLSWNEEPIKTFWWKITFPIRGFWQVDKRGIFHATVQTVTFDGVKLLAWDKTKNSLNSIAICSLPWSLLTQYYECDSELNVLPQKIRNGVLLVVKEYWQKKKLHQEQLGLFLSGEKARLRRIFSLWLLLFIGLSGDDVSVSKFLVQDTHLMHFPLPYKMALYNCIILLRISII